ncbi:LPXTG cell wall anchor domain-containing protein [Kitasatospora aburaviensis]
MGGARRRQRVRPAVVGPQYIQVEITSQAPTLAVQAPASIGNGGQPVEFTQTVTNPGSTEATYVLEFDVSNPAARGEGRLAMDLRDADGTWKPVLTAFRKQNDGFHFQGGRANMTVPAGATRTFQLRLSAPLNNDWAGLSGTVKLSSSVREQTGQYVIAESTKDIALKALDVKVKDAPTTAVAGGDPVEFDVTVTNSSSSRYNNAHPAVMADRNSALQVQEADGSWHDVTGIPGRQSDGPVTYYLTEDQNLAADASVTKHVRIAFTSLAPAGTTSVNPVVVLGADEPNGTAYVGPQGFPVDLTEAASGATTGATGTGTVRTGTGTGTGAHTAVTAGLITTHAGGSDNAPGSTGTTGSSGTTRTAGGELAHTGSDGTLKAALGAGSLLAGGIGAVLFARRRRTA